MISTSLKDALTLVAFGGNGALRWQAHRVPLAEWRAPRFVRMPEVGLAHKSYWQGSGKAVADFPGSINLGSPLKIQEGYSYVSM